MKEGLSNLRIKNLMANLEKNRGSHIDAYDFKLNQTYGRAPLQTMKFDVRKHYKMLKENHPFYEELFLQKENEIRRTYIAISENVPTLKPSNLVTTQKTPKKYAKEKLTKFKKGQEMNFNELY